jgi:hypothetical protein
MDGTHTRKKGIPMLIMYDQVLRQTTKALELKFGPKRIWIPISQIGKEDLAWNIMELPDWLVRAKGLSQFEAARKISGMNRR